MFDRISIPEHHTLGDYLPSLWLGWTADMAFQDRYMRLGIFARLCRMHPRWHLYLPAPHTDIGLVNRHTYPIFLTSSRKQLCLIV